MVSNVDSFPTAQGQAVEMIVTAGEGHVSAGIGMRPAWTPRPRPSNEGLAVRETTVSKGAKPSEFDETGIDPPEDSSRISDKETQPSPTLFTHRLRACSKLSTSVRLLSMKLWARKTKQRRVLPGHW